VVFPETSPKIPAESALNILSVESAKLAAAHFVRQNRALTGSSPDPARSLLQKLSMMTKAIALEMRARKTELGNVPLSVQVLRSIRRAILTAGFHSGERRPRNFEPRGFLSSERQ
jgi:hypothetical protein